MDKLINRQPVEPQLIDIPKLRTALKQRKWTHEDLANKLGMSRPLISLMLANRRRVSTQTVIGILEKTDITLSEIAKAKYL